MNTGFWIQWTNSQIRIGLESGKSLDLAVLFDAISKVPSMENSNYHLTNIGYFLIHKLDCLFFWNLIYVLFIFESEALNDQKMTNLVSTMTFIGNENIRLALDQNCLEKSNSYDLPLHEYSWKHHLDFWQRYYAHLKNYKLLARL